MTKNPTKPQYLISLIYSKPWEAWLKYFHDLFQHTSGSLFLVSLLGCVAAMSKETEMLLLSHGMGSPAEPPGCVLCMGGHHNPNSDVSSTGTCLGILKLPADCLGVLISMKLEQNWEEIPRGDLGHCSAQHESVLLEHSQGFASETAAGHICNWLQKHLCRFRLPRTGDSSVPLAAPVSCFQSPALRMYEICSSTGKRVS